MTEEEWLACTDSLRMVQFLTGKADGRKFRLFACACCRLLVDMLPDKRSMQAIEIAERYADGLASGDDLAYAEQLAWDVVEDWDDAPEGDTNQPEAILVANAVQIEKGPDSADFIAAHDIANVAHVYTEVVGTATFANLLRDIIGNPFRPVCVDSERARIGERVSWLAWNSGTLRNLAQAIYADRAFDRLPILADALEDAGCSDAGILEHCREGGEHCRGCWVVDLLLGKD
jgi:hypothetical protein